MSDKKRPWRKICELCRSLHTLTGPMRCRVTYYETQEAAEIGNPCPRRAGKRIEHWDGAKWVPVEEGESNA